MTGPATEHRPGWAIIVHGGAKEIEPEKEAPNRRGCAAAAEAGRDVLARGGSAVEAVEAAIRLLEADPTFNAAFGADLNEDGAVQLDAGLMEGARLDVGAVCGTTGLRHPISVCRALLTEGPVLLSGDGARRFAADQGAELCDPGELISPEQAAGAASSDNNTVGAVALDAEGNIAAGTSTGGLPGAAAGRVGDSPLPGCGFYADNGVGGVSLSGEGESIARMMVAARIMQRLEHRHPAGAIDEGLAAMERVGGDAGAIAIDAQGQIGWNHRGSHFAVALMRDGMNEPQVWLSKEEDADDRR
jgi:beta-aspartyl-peptidase (threonine type)